LTPKHHESDTTVHRGRITKQGSRLVRWAAVEAVQHTTKGVRLRALQDRVEPAAAATSPLSPRPGNCSKWSFTPYAITPCNA
jgi:hypothetical protein